MPDPLDILRRRDEAERDQANFLLDALTSGANLIQDDAAERVGGSGASFVLAKRCWRSGQIGRPRAESLPRPFGARGCV